jgi:hypothetical protein
MLGLIPEADNTFLQVIQLIRKSVEEMTRGAKACNIGEPGYQKNSTPKDIEKLLRRMKLMEKKTKRKMLIKTINMKKKLRNLTRKHMHQQQRALNVSAKN